MRFDKPPVAPQPPRIQPSPEKQKPVGPNSQNDEQARHAPEAKELRKQLQTWGNILGVISGALGFAALFAGPVGAIIGAIASAVLGIAGAVLGCLASGVNVDCIVNVILALVPAGASAVTLGLRKILTPIVRAAIDAAGAAIGGLGAWKSADGLVPLR